eukprot:g1413.t1
MPGRLPKNEDAEAGRSITESSPLIEKPKEVSLSNPLQWLRSLSQSYTWKLLAMVACTNHLLKGFVAGGGDEGALAVAIIPFALKPLVALMSDAFPIGGYHKLPYVVIFTMLSFISIMTVGLGLATTEAAVVAALFLAFLQVASIDVLMAAKSSEEVLVVLWPALGNFMGEHPAPGRAGWPLVFQQHKVLCRLTLLIGALALFLVVSTFIMDERQLLQIAAAMASIVLVSFAVFIRREIAGPVIFFFLLGLLNLNIDGALFYFCLSGPHFSPKFYITGLGGATFLGITVGYASGPGLFRSWSYRNICYITLVMRATTQLAMVPLLRRMQLGIPDSYWLLMVMSLDSMVQAWRWIPKQVLAAHLTPKGVEATCLGLHAGTFNMANVLSSYCGSFLLSYLGFDNLWKVQCMAALLPLFLLFLVPVLVPKKMQTELAETRVQVQQKNQELATAQEQLKKKFVELAQEKEASQELRWQIRQLREETEEQLNQKSIELTQEQEVAVKMREEVQQLVDAATNANEIRAALESELAGAKAELASNHAQRTRLEARNLELEEQAGVPRNFWMQLQAHFFEAQYEYFSSRVDSKIDALVAGIEGLNMLMRNLDSAYLCPLLAAKNFKLVAEWATAASHPWRARCLLQLGNIFKLQAMARWYNQLPQSEPRETASKRFEPRLQVEYTIAVTQLHASLQTPLRPLVRWQGAQPRIQVQSICNYRSPAALRNMYAYAHYSKMLVIHQAFLSESPDWVFFIDCDAFFTDAQTSLADILATYGATELSGPHFLVAEDPGGINTGTAEKCKLCFRSFRTF